MMTLRKRIIIAALVALFGLSFGSQILPDAFGGIDTAYAGGCSDSTCG